ncbi:phage tail tape measure protein [Leeuwenhoekiella marinoflava]|uniref:Tubulin-specific chaperone A n=2 Tax=Leeuwenhoekiella marinoflava TaxID=988 RepID=A0A4Q0PNC7_9FLAO|nr:phage tail tape measure protein [Leeuwenhoekiella marinoflava]RXG32066.1 tubulin-specific chaperone A [Leeuwenhoekiella marinoflava]SHE96802.1 tubulin-specific chaperone A [Leeuwenhoekiella marinoflava DSM 3653]
MAKRIVDEEMRFSIIINGNEAQKELLDLEKANRKLLTANQKNRTEQRKLERQGKQNTARYKELSAEIAHNTTELQKNYTRMNKLEQEIGVTNLSITQLTRKLKALRVAWSNSTPGTKAYLDYEKQIAEVNQRLSVLRGKARGAKSGLSSLADGFNKYSALAVSFIAVLTGVVFKIQQFIDFNGKMADAISDVQKTTGLAKTEVEDLAKSFGLLQTRTNRINLLKIAEEGGRIGIAKEEIGAFVEVMNKAVVALGDSFPGGVEETASKLGKLKLLFKETKDLGVDEAYNAIGSAINELGADGVATEINIANFATRVGSLPEALKPTVAEALALGAAFEESGIEAEIAARAYNIFLKQASTETEKFGIVMGISAEEVTKLINTNPLEFMIQFAKGMKGMNATETAQTLDYLKVNADGANKVLGAMSNNTELFRERLELSNQAMAEGTSLIDEYNIKNNNFAATLDKLKKVLNGVFLSETLVNGLSTLVNWLALLLGATEDVTGSGRRWREQLVFLAKIIAVVTAALITNTAWLKLVTLWEGRATQGTILYNLAQKAKLIATEASIAATIVYTGVTALLTGNINAARLALRALATTMRTTPWGLVISLVTAAAVAYYAFRDETDHLTSSTEVLNRAMNKGSEEAGSLRAKIDALRRVAEDEALAEELRVSAMKELNKIVPNYNKNLDLSTAALKRGKIALDNYVDGLKRQAETQYLTDKIKNKTQELLEAENANAESFLSTWDEIVIRLGQMTQGLDPEEEKIRRGNSIREERIDVLRREAEAAAKAWEAYNNPVGPNQNPNPVEYTDLLNFETPEDPNAPGFDPGNLDKAKAAEEAAKQAAKDAKARRKEQEREAKRLADDLLKLKGQENETKISLIEDDFQREMELLEENHRQKTEELKAQLVTEGNLSEEQIAINGSIRRQLKLQEEKFQFDKGAIIERGYQDDIDLMEEAYKKEAAVREVRHQEELNAIGDNLNAREKLKEKHRQEDLEAEEAHVKEVINALKFITENGQFEGFDLSLLTPEETAKMQALMDQLVLKLRELKAAKDNVEGKDSGEYTLGDATANVDIFGMTASQWVETLNNLDQAGHKFELIKAATGAALNVYQEYSNLMAAKEQKSLQQFEKKQSEEERTLKQKLDARLISQKQYDAAVAASEAELEKKKAELAYKQAKRDRTVALANIAMNTAQAVVAIWAQVPKFDFGISAGILAGFVTALGALQAATVLATPLPVKGYQDGLYNVTREQDGKPFKARYGGESRSGLVDFPTVFMAGEEGKTRPEMIINGQDYSNFSDSFKDSLYRELGRVKGYADGYYQNSTAKPSFEDSAQSSSGVDTMMFSSVMNRFMDMMDRLERDGLVAYLKRDYENARKIKEDIEDYDRLRNKNRY